MTFLRPLMIAAALTAGAAHAGPVSFSSGWNEQKLSLFSNNRYSFGNALSMTSDGGVSIAWKRIAQSDWQASRASWSWTVEESVPATDLRQKGGDEVVRATFRVIVAVHNGSGTVLPDIVRAVITKPYR